MTNKQQKLEIEFNEKFYDIARLDMAEYAKGRIVQRLGKARDPRPEILAFIKSRFISKKELQETLEGNKIPKPKCYCKTHPEHNCGFTSNEALNEIKEKLCD